MSYRLMGRLHAAALSGPRSDAGQGTVEYVGLILLIAAVIAGVVGIGSHMKGGGIAETIVGKLKDAIEGVGKGGKGG